MTAHTYTEIAEKSSFARTFSARVYVIIVTEWNSHVLLYPEYSDGQVFTTPAVPGGPPPPPPGTTPLTDQKQNTDPAGTSPRSSATSHNHYFDEYHLSFDLSSLEGHHHHRRSLSL